MSSPPLLIEPTASELAGRQMLSPDLLIYNGNAEDVSIWFEQNAMGF